MDELDDFDRTIFMTPIDMGRSLVLVNFFAFIDQVYHFLLLIDHLQESEYMHWYGL